MTSTGAYAEISTYIRQKVSPQTFEIWRDCGERVGDLRWNYFRMSPVAQLNFADGQFANWAQCVADLNAEYPQIAPPFVKNSPVGIVPARFVMEWADELKQIHNSNAGAGELARQLTESTYELAGSGRPHIFLKFCRFLARVTAHQLDLGEQILGVALINRESFNAQQGTLLDIVHQIASDNPQYAAQLFATTTAKLAHQNPILQAQFLALLDLMNNSGEVDLLHFVNSVFTARQNLTTDELKRALAKANKLASNSAQVAQNYLVAVAQMAENMAYSQIELWCEAGVTNFPDDKHKLAHYFDIKRPKSLREVRKWGSAIIIEEIKPTLDLYCNAVAKRPTEVVVADDASTLKGGWIETHILDEDSAQIVLPAMMNETDDLDANFSICKFACTHQAGYSAFGTFEFKFDAPARELHDLRTDLRQHWRQAGIGAVNPNPFSELLSIFAKPNLAKAILNVAENFRIDSQISQNYHGLTRDYQVATDVARKNRPAAAPKTPSEAILGAMVSYALHQTKLKLPKAHKAASLKILSLLKLLTGENATIELSAEVVCRVYVLLEQVADQKENDLAQIEVKREAVKNYTETKADEARYLEALLAQMPAPDEPQTDEPTAEAYEDLTKISHWGNFEPEKMDIFSAGAELSDAELDETQLTADMATTADNQTDQQANEMRDSTEQPAQEARKISNYSSPKDDSTAEIGADIAFRYDEWDCYAAEYKRHWCAVYERATSDLDNAFYNNVLSEYGAIFNRIKRQFELIAPDLHAKRKRLADGDEIDIDAAINAQIDLRCKLTPDEKVYWTRTRRERSVAVAFLIDISASTAESISTSENIHPQLASNVKYNKSILDLEKVSIALMARAIEILGDRFGIYAFSGYGRENVEVHIIKELSEARELETANVVARLGTISPSHATRMGAAIRHINTKLSACDEVTKLLFLISDGRPQDRGYSRDGTDREYAVEDTRMALQEAAELNIVPFCLTVDREGNSYLGKMMSGFNYEVLDDIAELPARLPQVYQNLTV